MRTCIKITDLEFPIKLEQHETMKLFCVTYGQQVSDGLTYEQAAAELGESILHALACAGRLDNEGA